MSPVTRANHADPPGIYRSHAFGSASIASASNAATYLLAPGFANGAPNALTTNLFQNANFWFDPAEYAVAGRTTRCRVTAVCQTPETASTITHSVGLYPITGSTGATTELKNTVGAVVEGSEVKFESQAKETMAYKAGTVFVPPTAGMFALADLTSNTNTTNCRTFLRATLQVTWI